MLAAILFPVFARAKNQAQKSASLSNIRQIALSISMYSADYDERTIPSNTASLRYPVPLQSYVKDWNMFRSPAQTVDPDGWRDPNNSMYQYMLTLAPDYGYNANYLSADPPNSNSFKGVTLSRIQNAAETVMLVSSTFWNNGPQIGFHRVEPPAKWTGTSPLQWTSYGYCWPRYNGQFVVAFADGHAKSQTVAQLGQETLWDLD